jgi:SAM-dependent methyltransferase
MAINVHQELHEGLFDDDQERLEFTRRAFRALPRLRRPRILDVGCGRGDPTLELAKLTDGVIVGLDIDRESLTELAHRADAQGLSDRVGTMHCSIFDMTFPDESYDIIWAEASIHIVGFEKGLDDWQGYLKPSGFLVVHEMAWLRADPPRELAHRWQSVYPGIRTVPEYVAEIPRHGYVLLDHFALPDDFWWGHYYGPLEGRIAELREKYHEDQQILKQLEREQREVDLYRKHPGWYGSAYFVMQKCER